ncbi:YesL family protein [Streptococcus parasanguinis]|uniref:YesL family protein n=1 Tax=Streptococcus parasanguinis TaxID=1318 RepID=UPI00214F9350|nr:YesL family protein [Streptococcus parasanguinis]MCR4486700.1 YesL family protein [Streptococcus parasanguinis]
MSQRETGLIKTVFNTDNLVMRISEKIADLVTVNLLFVLSCLPIVTIGIAKISLYQTVFAIKHQRRLPVIRTYISAFRENWKLGLQLGGMELLVSGICLFDLLLFWNQTTLPMQALKAVCLGLFIFLVLVMLAAYPIAARYQLDWKECLQKAMIVTGLHFPWFFVMGSALLLLCMALASSVLAFLLGLMIFFLFGFSSLAFAQVGLMEKIFAHYQE